MGLRAGGAREGKGRGGDLRLWGIAAFAAAGFQLLYAFLFPFTPPAPGESRAVPAERLFLAGGGGEADAVAREHAELFDSAPIFIPTRWNHANLDRVPREREAPGELFSLFEPRITFSEQYLRGGGHPRGLLGVPRAEMLGGGAPFRALGKEEREVRVLPRRLAAVELRPLAGGGRSFTRSLPPKEESGAGDWPAWAPAEFLVTVDFSGFAAEPFLVQSSGFEEVDRYFRQTLPALLEEGEGPLPPGLYRVLVAP